MVVVSITTVAVLLGSAVESQAGLLDYIWDTSGPPFLGLVFRCRQALKTESDPDDQREREQKTMRCDPLFSRSPSASSKPVVSMVMESGFYVQFGKDGKTDDGRKIPFDFLNGVALAFEPIVEVHPPFYKKWPVYHGVGVTALAIASDDFPFTGNLGYKIRVVRVEWKGWSAAVNLRLFPDGFSDDQFGAGPPPTGDREKELSVGFSVGF
jgi:hypothetical protein